MLNYTSSQDKLKVINANFANINICVNCVMWRFAFNK